MAVLARPGETFETIRSELQGHEALVLGVDVADRQALGQALQSVQESMGFPEVLVWNASQGIPGLITPIEDRVLLKDLEANLFAPLDAIRWVLPEMRRVGRGTLLITGGGLALDPKPVLASSSLGKALQRHLALLLDGELREGGIHVATLTVCGFVQAGTPLSPESVAEELWNLHEQKPGDWKREKVLHA